MQTRGAGIGEQFLLCVLLITEQKRRGLCALYAYMRLVDDAADEPGDVASKQRGLSRWRALTDAAYAGETSGHRDSSGVCGYVFAIFNSGAIFSRFNFRSGNGFDGAVVCDVRSAARILLSRRRNSRIDVHSRFWISRSTRARMWPRDWELRFN